VASLGDYVHMKAQKQTV